MADAEMMEEEKEMKVSGIREKMKEFDFMAYFYQTFNRTESLRWRNPRYSEQLITLAIGITLRPARSTPGFFSCVDPITYILLSRIDAIGIWVNKMLRHLSIWLCYLSFCLVFVTFIFIPFSLETNFARFVCRHF